MSADNTTSLQLNTSVLGTVDRRNGVDSALVDPGSPITDFSASLGLGELPEANQRFKADENFSAPDWLSINDNTDLISGDAAQNTITSGNVRVVAIQCTTALAGAINPVANPATYIACVFYHDGSVGNLFSFDGGPAVTVDYDKVYVDATDELLFDGPGLYLLILNGITESKLYKLYGNYVNAIVPTLAAPAISNNISVMGGGFTGGIVELLSYADVPDSAAVIDYLTKLYGGFTLPLTFPDDSSVPYNS